MYIADLVFEAPILHLKSTQDFKPCEVLELELDLFQKLEKRNCKVAENRRLENQITMYILT